MRTAAQIRQEFIDFFRERHGHVFVPSSPVVPHEDPTLLFTNAGMNQFKPFFLGTEQPKQTRVANTQKCIRAGGKHNDLDDVGHDTYHHTFFEMLGNWSFGDYFKKEAIAWAWELLTEVWGIEKSRLHATYFEGDESEGLEPDHEAKELWATVTDINPAHIHPGNKTDNFWEMGETGPCGPCSEIHVDLTPDESGAALVNAGDPRVIEIWNLVFIQFNRGSDGRLTPLPAKHVDTGMGFERVTALLQGKHSNYDTDVFTPLFEAIREVTGAGVYKGTLPPSDLSNEGSAADPQIMLDVTYRVIADHVRCLTFALTDGAVPDREGRGYVLRRILRRGVRYGWQYLGMHEPFLYRLVDAVVESMGEAFPELRRDSGRVREIIREEEESFGNTLERGIALFDQAADEARKRHHNEIRGEDAFRLHDTYGFPIDLTEIMAAERGLRVDIGEYERLMEAARDRARAAGKGGTSDLDRIPAERITGLGATDDSAKYETATMDAAVMAIVRFDDSDADAEIIAGAGTLKSGQRGALIFAKTCFYAEAGGQVGDVGVITGPQTRFVVEDVRRIGEIVLHFGHVESGEIEISQTLRLEVDEQRRLTMKNHTATHVLNWALREVLGENVQQKGSLVDSEKTRFDFSHNKALAPDELGRVEDLVNERIKAELPLYSKVVPQEKALEITGLRAVFGEKYPDHVRVCCIGKAVDELLADPGNKTWRDYSIEFCGGTHLRNTAEIESFVLTTEEAVAKGIRRVVGITGPTARRAIEEGEQLRAEVEALRSRDAEALQVGLAQLQNRLGEVLLPIRVRQDLQQEIAELQKKLKQLQKEQAAESADVVNQRIDALWSEAARVGDTLVFVAELPDVPVEQLKSAADRVKQKAGSAAVLFGVRSDDKAVLLAAMSDDLVKKGIKAGDLVKAAAKHVKGGGGGPPTMAQAGGKDPGNLPAALDAGRTWIQEKL